MDKFYFYALLFLLVLFGYLTYKIMQPFLAPIAWAAVFSILFYPLYRVILERIKQESIASLIVLIAIILIIIGPLSYLLFLLAGEAVTMVEYIESKQIVASEIYRHPLVTSVIERITSLFNISEKDLQETVLKYLSTLGRRLVGGITVGVGSAISVVVDFIIMALTIFFLLRDGPRFFKKVRGYLPFPGEQKIYIEKQVKDIIISTMYGGVIIALVQGTIGGLVFLVLGLHGSVLWGFVMAVASLLPAIGTVIVWGPAALYLIITGSIWKGITLILIGALVISSVDNVVRPLIVGKRTQMHFLILFFSVLGGMQVFGFVGFIMGPLVFALFISIIQIFRSVGNNIKSSVSEQ